MNTQGQIVQPLQQANAEPGVRRTRKSAPKVRTGCNTCKIRRVKCDESKPSCHRCTSTGRKCDGYDFVKDNRSGVVFPLPGRKVQSSVSLTLFKPFEGTVQERRAFARFQHLTVPAFAGCTELEFWSNLLVQASTQDLVIRHAVIALAILHEAFEIENGKYITTSDQNLHYRDAAFQLQKSIDILQKRMSNPSRETLKIAIIASVLFTCYQTLHREDMSSIVHYNWGMKTLIGQMSGSPKSSTSKILPDKPRNAKLPREPEDDVDKMLRVFARFDIQACTFAKLKAETLDVESLGRPPASMTLVSMRGHLENLLIVAYQIVKSDLAMYRYWKARDVSTAWRQKRYEALDLFERWMNRFEQDIPTDVKTIASLGQTEARSLFGLFLQAKVAMIMLETSIDSGHEINFDMFHADFENMVARAEELTKAFGFCEAEPLEANNTPFTMELGIVHPLFYIACKCRDWDLRRRAIVQLRKAGKEGVWDGPIMALVASRVMHLEEQGLQRGDLVPERARVHHIWKENCYAERVVKVKMKFFQDDTWLTPLEVQVIIPF